jgi:dTDP-6-deoxy-L-talose 4-dehydrogenase (NAD+)
MYGEGQNPGSLLAQLDRAIEAGDPVFNMSGGEQLRDYLPVQQVAAYLVTIAESPNFGGIVNVCSGVPISVRRLVEQRIADRKSMIRLNLGYYPYPDYEPMAFWGDRHKLDGILEGRQEWI